MSANSVALPHGSTKLKNKLKNVNPKEFAAQTVIIIVILILFALQFFPIFITFSKSVKSLEQDFLHPYALTFPFEWANYSAAWDNVKDLFFNTFILAFANVGFTLILSSMGAFAFVRFRFPCKEIIFTAILSIMMIPGTLTMVAQFMLVDTLNLLHTRWAVILPTIAGNSSFNIFLLRTFFSGVPGEVFEAAEIDGASKPRQFLHFMIPLSLPIIFTAGIMLFMQSWNDLIWPMMVLKEEDYTIATGLIPFTTEYYRMTGSYSVPMAGYVLTSIPLIVLFFFTSKQFIGGLTSGAFKM